MECPKCGSNNRDDELRCAKCGAELKSKARDDTNVFPCPHCGTENYDTATECKSCHEQIRSPFIHRTPAAGGISHPTASAGNANRPFPSG